MDTNEVDSKRALGVCICVDVCACIAYAYMTYAERTAHHDHSFDSVYCYVLLFVVGLASFALNESIICSWSYSLSLFSSFIWLLEYSLRCCCCCCVNMCFSSSSACMRESYAHCTLYGIYGCESAIWIVAIWREGKMSDRMGESAFSLFVRVCMCAPILVYVRARVNVCMFVCCWKFISRASTLHRFPNANTYNKFFFHAVVLYVEAFWFRFCLPHFIPTNNKRKTSFKKANIHSRFLVSIPLFHRVWSVLTHCLTLSLNFIPFVFIFILMCVITTVRWVFVNWYTDICRSLIVNEPRSNKKVLAADWV